MNHSYIQDVYRNVGNYETSDCLDSRSSEKRFKYTKMLLMKLIKKNSVHSILEIGPGPGYMTKGICDIIHNKNIMFDILDFSDTFANSTFKNNKSNISNIYIDDISSQNFSFEKKYDLVIFQEVLEHTISPYQTMYNINTILNSGSKLLLTIPNGNYFKDIINIYSFFGGIKKKNTMFDTHIAEFSPMGAIKLFSMTGFEIESLDYYAGYGFLLLDCLLSSQVGFVLKKIRRPEDSWKILEKEVILL
ncbi:methyltransferase domain-containing protein [Campylobacter concisus]|uniref:methyltransferase domain-containing protein n=2 Tax=Campylobacter concisus TaxID=199 RepID=UPI00122CB0FC|nr:methyltransferase domain-containing protein [Campylobacter concisus]